MRRYAPVQHFHSGMFLPVSTTRNYKAIRRLSVIDLLCTIIAARMYLRIVAVGEGITSPASASKPCLKVSLHTAPQQSGFVISTSLSRGLVYALSELKGFPSIRISFHPYIIV
jgi:hypothetical protein